MCLGCTPRPVPDSVGRRHGCGSRHVQGLGLVNMCRGPGPSSRSKPNAPAGGLGSLVATQPTGAHGPCGASVMASQRVIAMFSRRAHQELLLISDDLLPEHGLGGLGLPVSVRVDQPQLLPALLVFGLLFFLSVFSPADRRVHISQPETEELTGFVPKYTNEHTFKS